jgi:Clp amino terminal domain, pathogenicity island component
MFERFTDKARKVVFLAKGKATERGDDQIRPVHMLYGLAAADGVAARVLALKEARALHHTYIGTEHVLLGLLRVAERQPNADFAAVTLRDLGLDLARVRMLVLDELRQLQT